MREHRIDRDHQIELLQPNRKIIDIGRTDIGRTNLRHFGGGDVALQ